MRLTGYIRSADDDTLSISAFQTAPSHIELACSSVLAAFKDEKEESRVTLLIAKDAQVSVVRRCDASQLVATPICGCDPDEVGVAEARPYGSIHPALAKLSNWYFAHWVGVDSHGANEFI